MKYTFECKKCNKEKTLDIPMSKINSTKVFCDCCGGEMHQNLKNNHLIVPENMRAEQISEMSYLNNMMKTRPSGKTKSIY